MTTAMTSISYHQLPDCSAKLHGNYYYYATTTNQNYIIFRSVSNGWTRIIRIIARHVSNVWWCGGVTFEEGKMGGWLPGGAFSFFMSSYAVF